MPESKRQLAAIMFTDIQGYTALMQQDEKRALKIRNKHRAVFNEQTEKHHGKILQYYGDGTLSIFDSAIDAVNCGIEMQQEFQAEPKIPVRIGIHTGDILISDEEVIGDGVNVASRIESIAVPGSVLISGKVFDEVKNHAAIQSLALRSFRFKNVEKPIEVFAISNEGLTIPDMSKLKSKSEDAEAGQDKLISSSNKRKKWIYWLAGVAILALVTFSIIFLKQDAKVKPITSLAVLPLKDISEGPQEEYYSAGMTEALIAELSKIKALRVISRTSAMQYKDTKKSIPEIARELNIDALIEGSIIRTEDKIRVVAQLIATQPERHLWAQSFDRDLVDILSLYSDVANAIAEEVEIAITPEERMQFSKGLKVNPEALEAFLKGKYHANNKSAHGLFTSLNYLESAIELDSTFADAFAWLAYTLIEIGNFGFQSSKDTYPRALNAAETALSLNSNLDMAYACMGRIKMVYEYDWDSAENAFEKAMNINSNKPMSLEWYADYLFAIGKHAEAEKLINQCLLIDPFSKSTLLHLGQLHWLRAEYDQAIETFEKVLELDPNFAMAYLFLGNVYTEKGLYEEGLRYLNRFDELSGGEHPLAIIGTAINFALSGQQEKALQLARELEAVSAENSASLPWIAVIHASLEENEEAIRWLQKAYEERSNSLYLINNLIHFDQLRSDPEFKNLQQKIGLLPDN